MDDIVEIQYSHQIQKTENWGLLEWLVATKTKDCCLELGIIYMPIMSQQNDCAAKANRALVNGSNPFSNREQSHGTSKKLSTYLPMMSS
jgi:hypothetical protein